MPRRYRVKNFTCESGERLTLLLNDASGIPLFEPTLFVLTELRALNRASATLAQALRSVMVGLMALDYMGVDLDARIAKGLLLDLGEIEELVLLSAATQEALDNLPERKTEDTQPGKVSSLEKVRMRANTRGAMSTVGSESAGIRLMYIRDYIAWLARRRLLRLDHKHPTYLPLSSTSQLVIASLNERIRTSSRRNSVELPQGMEKAHIERMLDVIRPDSPENPWKGGHVRVRNQLIFNMLLALGLRKSELLVARLEDLDLRTNQVLIARRADDPLDPRADAPNTKTLDRLLVLSDDLAQMIRSYIKERRLIAGARRYPHLLLANGTGRPLSKQALNKLFVELRTKVPGLPDELQPHVLRHSWNDEFSALMDRRNIAPAEEERMRKQQMGWSDNSKMSAVYTKRHTKRRTDKASLDLQTEMMSKGADKE